MNGMISAQEIKRRGISVVDAELQNGPVHILLHNKPCYVLLSESTYLDLMNDLAEARLAASEVDVKAGRVQRGDANQLMTELLSPHE